LVLVVLVVLEPVRELLERVVPVLLGLLVLAH
jgi:hypothetical protein